MPHATDERDEEFAGTIHATGVAIGGHGVLLRGASGAGKSDLALRLIDRGAILISDDYIHVARADDGSATARTAPRIGGRIEARGVGIVTLPHVESAPVSLVVELGQGGGQRLPDPDADRVRLCGVNVPAIRLDAFEASAPIKVELALRHICGLAFPAGAS